MFYFIHVLLGGLIGIYFNSVLLVFVLAFLSHFFLDMIPHWNLDFDRDNFKMNSEISFTKKTATFFLLDILLALILLDLLYFSFRSELIVFGALAAVLPDVVSLGYFTKLRHNKHYKRFIHFHNNIQKDTGFIVGIITQLIMAAILLIIIF